MSSKKSKWKNSVQKARRVSQSSSAHSTRKSSIIGEETTANELEEYLETLKKKSGVKSLWRGDSFDRVVRDEEDKTPDISISSTDDHEELGKISASPIFSFRSCTSSSFIRDFLLWITFLASAFVLQNSHTKFYNKGLIITIISII